MSVPKKKVVLVTGASSGIAQATAGLLAEKGYYVGMAALTEIMVRPATQEL